MKNSSKTIIVQNWIEEEEEKKHNNQWKKIVWYRNRRDFFFISLLTYQFNDKTWTIWK